MAMIMEGCQGKPQLKVMEKPCPNCGEPIEIFSVDIEAACEKCGTVIYNDTLLCVQWCHYAKQCVGEDRYEQLMKVVQSQKERAAREKEQQG